ncbi:23S rRNA pseudouridine1911/1915/1917 synthase [Arcanobacterium wilhelmae]|uniref:Pseudouridine synthase n=1 Tax=Arcanobacterium wilhelmae TaxID=1803177 RepID=A0ABT9N961_9ACTO|nr:RluA family pseudouridine synthase [Arcanobacterium wilhelmae]MDP9800240.1 23S rRNA pseudouridine1911/1915/1917 synthase [Arcanobacterium wilhelmae]WFN89679.1 RluA family pseudouridine synthase [Arcanobacterium wilhelmae]
MSTYLVPPGFDGDRIDSVLASLTGLSRSKAAALVAGGQVSLDGRGVGKSERVSAGAVISAQLPPPPSPEPQPTPIDNLHLLYEDADIVVVDKPAGVAAHASLNFEGPNVLGALLGAGITLTTSGPPERKGIVHRLDVGTTGAMVVAKSERAYTVLKRAFKERTVTKIYHALVQGHPDPLSGTIEAPIGRDFRHQWKMGIREDGKRAVTHYDTLEAMAGATLCEVHLETGRTHQIRVHMSAIKHPCVGDEMYGADMALGERLRLTRQWLHAVRLGFAHPVTGKYVEFTSQYPADLQKALDMMREGML